MSCSTQKTCIAAAGSSRLKGVLLRVGSARQGSSAKELRAFRVCLTHKGSLKALYQKSGPRNSRLCCTSQDGFMSEEDAWKKRNEEAKEIGNNTDGEWRWTLNWDQVLENPSVLVGSCPRSPEDVDRLVEEAGVEAIVCLQSDDCFQALGIDWEAIRLRALERGVIMSRVAVRDFDKNDQANMLPECVRALAGHVRAGRRTYVHCTAGINRASLTVVGYLTFVESRRLDEALHTVKSNRSQAHPYVESWKLCCQRLLEGRSEELIGRSRDIYKRRCENGSHGDSKSDWENAELELIRDTFMRRLEADATTAGSLQYVLEHRSMEQLEKDMKSAREVVEAEVAEKMQQLGAEKEAVEKRAKLARRELDHALESATARAQAAEKRVEELSASMAQLEADVWSLREGRSAPVALEPSGNIVAAQFDGYEASERAEAHNMEATDVPTVADPLLSLCSDFPDLEECVVYYGASSPEVEQTEGTASSSM
ncbi:hypothetical protein CYMTET_42998 [Cymbomonas tetramitiformis]|uniref:Tyrosine specific protein phosphatases domain-containing protein n=1 Tax=Cymbomonas tetramitiformis TaxID=36881 RepID=A0AAE0C4P1_9CHLO|nr:hypothetical protein CYMTET_42998 [Cymbomonas tetramitiformis]